MADDKDIKALKFNIMKEAIGNNPIGLANRIPGEPVMGSYFILLKDKLK